MAFHRNELLGTVMIELSKAFEIRIRDDLRGSHKNLSWTLAVHSLHQ